MARNVVGWKEGNGDTLDLSKLGGAEGNLNGVSAYEIFATVRDTEVNAAAGVAVDAHNRLQLEAINGALSVPTGAGAAALALLEVGATALVATNRMRTDTRAQVSDSERKKKFAAAGVVSISAVDAVTDKHEGEEEKTGEQTAPEDDRPAVLHTDEALDRESVPKGSTEFLAPPRSVTVFECRS